MPIFVINTNAYPVIVVFDKSAFRTWLRNYRLRYISGHHNLIQRMLREEGNWQGHLDNTRAAIMAAVDRLDPRSVRVLGSGWLLDVPLKELAERCERITLCDIIHPQQIVSKYADSGTITFETVDITGGLADRVYNQRRRRFDFDRFMGEVRGITPWVYPEDLIVSANLLSQLSVFLADYLADKVKLGGGWSH